jgi:hypothetical protein
MADEQTTQPEHDTSTILVEIAPEHLEAVLEFVGTLEATEAEVSGYSFTQPSAGFTDTGLGFKGGARTLTQVITTDDGTIHYGDKDK